MAIWILTAEAAARGEEEPQCADLRKLIEVLEGKRYLCAPEAKNGKEVVSLDRLSVLTNWLLPAMKDACAKPEFQKKCGSECMLVLAALSKSPPPYVAPLRPPKPPPGTSRSIAGLPSPSEKKPSSSLCCEYCPNQPPPNIKY